MLVVKSIGFTGTQHGMTVAQKATLTSMLEGHEGWSFHHGDCKGSDVEAAQIAFDLKLRPIGHPPSKPDKRGWFPYGAMELPKDYLPRNRDIVYSADVMIATPKGYTNEQRSGTWYTIRFARQQRVKLCVIWPDGKIKFENQL